MNHGCKLFCKKIFTDRNFSYLDFLVDVIWFRFWFSVVFHLVIFSISAILEITLASSTLFCKKDEKYFLVVL